MKGAYHEARVVGCSPTDLEGVRVQVRIEGRCKPIMLHSDRAFVPGQLLTLWGEGEFWVVSRLGWASSPQRAA